jgi:demethylmenaquinone methyltransferase/2-methoxy-6-polyprenyl-1,4-benzoquinol methylase
MATAEVTQKRLGSGEMFDSIAHRYDLLNRLMSFGIDQRWRKKLVAALELPPNGKCLDLATGTADVALMIARRHPTVSVHGVDPSPRMLEVGQVKSEKGGFGNRVTFEVGDAQGLTQAAASVDAISMAFGIRNVPDRSAALAEMARVVRPGGRIGILELSEPPPGILGALARFHVHHLVPWIGSLLSGSKEYRYLQQSIQAFPPAKIFAGSMREAGLDVLEIVPLTFGVAHLYVATPRKPRP